MKKIEAIIKTFQLAALERALGEAGVPGMTVSEVRGFGGWPGHSEIYRGAEYVVDSRPEIKLEIGVPEAMVETVATILREAARAGSLGDGMVLVTTVVDAVRIRTGEHGEAALLRPVGRLGSSPVGRDAVAGPRRDLRGYDGRGAWESPGRRTHATDPLRASRYRGRPVPEVGDPRGGSRPHDPG